MEDDRPVSTKLKHAYEQTLRLQSQILSLIYDAETFGTSAGQSRFAKERGGGWNGGTSVTLTIYEALPPMKKLTEAIEEHWKAALHAAIGEAVWQGPLPHFEKAFVEIDVVTPRGSDNARLWDTSNRAINVIINNLKGIFLRTITWSIWPFRWWDGGVKKVLRSSVFRNWTNYVKLRLGVFHHKKGKTMRIWKCHRDDL